MIRDLVDAVIPVFLVMAAGAVMHARRWVDDSLDLHLMRLGLNLLFPCFIMSNIIGDPALDDFRNVVLAFCFGFGAIVTGLTLAFLVGPLFGLRRGTGQRTFALATSIQNYGFVAIPVLLALFGEEPLGVLFLHATGVELAIWTVGVMVLRGASGARWSALLNGPFIAVGASLGLHYLRGDAWIPSPIMGAATMLGTTAIPLFLFSIGIAIARQLEEEPLRPHWPTMTGACLLRLGVIPFLLLAGAKFIPMSLELQQVLLVQAGMPAAIVSIMLAKLYGGHPPTAIQVLVATTVLSIFTMPLILSLGKAWLGL